MTMGTKETDPCAKVGIPSHRLIALTVAGRCSVLGVPLCQVEQPLRPGLSLRSSPPCAVQTLVKP